MNSKINDLKTEKTTRMLFAAAWIIYAIISMTKSAYNASMASIIGEGLFDKTQAGTISASFYLFYGAAQILGVKVIDRFSPMKLVGAALVGTLISIVGMAMSSNFAMMLVFWSFCGLVQFPIWPAILRIISEYLLPKQKNKAMVYIAFSYCAGALANYLAASAVLAVSEWRMLFWLFALIVTISAVVWQIVTVKTKAVRKEQSEKNKEILIKETHSKENKSGGEVGLFKLLAMSGLLILLVPALIRSAMDMGMKTWIPTMITESYDVSASFASMLTSILMFVNLGGVYITNMLYPKRIKNVTVVYGICFLVSLPFTAMLHLMGKAPVALIVALLTITTTMMYAGHQVINVIVPSYFAEYNRTGSIASLLNAVASFGIVAANIGFGYLAENFGWNTAITTWIILDAVAVVTCAAAIPVWKKFTDKRERI